MMAKCLLYGCVIVTVSFIICSSHGLRDGVAKEKRKSFNEIIKPTKLGGLNQNKSNVNWRNWFSQENETVLNKFVNFDNLTNMLQKYPEFDISLLHNENSTDISSLHNITKLNSSEYELFKDMKLNVSTDHSALQALHNKMRFHEHQIQKDINGINNNFESLYQNDHNLYDSMSKMQYQLTHELMHYLSNISEYDKDFKSQLTNSASEMADNLKKFAVNMLEINWLMKENYETQKTKNIELENKLTRIEKELSKNKYESINTEYKVTKSTCNGRRRHLINNSCYYIPKVNSDSQLYTWWDARYHCKEVLGTKGDLCIVETKGEMDILVSLLSTHFGDIEEFWLGASNLDTKTSWNWVNGRTLDLDTFMNWVTSINLHTDAHCMSIYGAYQFNAEPCFYDRYPLCEIRFVD